MTKFVNNNPYTILENHSLSTVSPTSPRFRLSRSSPKEIYLASSSDLDLNIIEIERHKNLVPYPRNPIVDFSTVQHDIPTSEPVNVDTSLSFHPTPLTAPGNLDSSHTGDNFKKNDFFFSQRIDSLTIEKRKKQNNVFFMKFQNFNPDIRKNRAGIIPYCFSKKGELILCMGIDAKSGNITDFGGGYLPGEKCLTTALREFHEETLGIFPDINEHSDEIKDSFIVSDDHMMIMFVKIDCNFKEKRKEFLSRKKNFHHSENSDLFICNFRVFLDLVRFPGKNHLKIYSLVRDLFAGCVVGYADFSRFMRC